MELLKNFINDKNRLVLILILLFGLMKGCVFISLLPEWRAPDEIAYYNEIRIVAEQHKIPGLTTAKYIEHPPLYYIASYPFYSIGKIWGEKGIILAIRFFGILLLVVTGFIGYLITRKLFPDDDFIQLSTPAFIMLNPQLTFISGSINSDVMLNFFSTLLFWQGVLLIKEGTNFKRALLIILIIIGGRYSKERFLIALLSFSFLILLLSIRFFWKKIKTFNKPSLFINKRFIGIGLVIIFSIISPLLFESLMLGSGTNKVTTVAHKAFSANFGTYLFKQFWGYFDWLLIPMGNKVYLAINWILILALSGYVVALINFLGNFNLNLKRDNNSYEVTYERGREIIDSDIFLSYLFLSSSIFLSLLAASYYHIYGAGAQGRYLFVAIVPYSILIASGLGKLKAFNRIKPVFILMFCSLFSINFIALFNYIIPFYY